MPAKLGIVPCREVIHQAKHVASRRRCGRSRRAVAVAAAVGVIVAGQVAGREDSGGAGEVRCLGGARATKRAGSQR